MSEKPKAFRKVRRELAEKMAGEPIEVDRSELDSGGRPIWCAAHGCPLKASVCFGSALCSWHDVADRSQWPTVSAELNQAVSAGEMPHRPKLRPAEWVRQAAAKVKAHVQERGGFPNAFAALSEHMQARKEKRDTVVGLDDDAANALLREVS